MEKDKRVGDVLTYHEVEYLSPICEINSRSKLDHAIDWLEQHSNLCRIRADNYDKLAKKIKEEL